MDRDNYYLIILGCLACLTIFLLKMNMANMSTTSMIIHDYKKVHSKLLHLSNIIDRDKYLDKE